MMGLLKIYICKIDVAMLFLILAFNAIMIVESDKDDSKVKSSSCRAWCLLSFPLSWTLNAMWSEKLSIILSPDENSEWRGAKDGRLSLNLLAISTKWLLMSECWCSVRELRCIKFCDECTLLWGLMKECMRWLGGSLCVLSCDLPPRDKF